MTSPIAFRQAPLKPAGGPKPMVEGEFAFTEEDFRKIAAMLFGDAGIVLPSNKATLVYSRLAKRLRALGLSSFKAYCALVAGANGLDERQRMLAALTTNVTRFFREPHHFDHLREEILPPLLDAARRGGRVRIWSAACSSGQEPYSVAMTLLGLMPDAGAYDIKILATDIDPNMVAEGQVGVYSEQLLAGVAPEMRRKWLTPEPGLPGSWAVTDDIRALVSFRELNLVGDWPMKGRFDAILCRNVVIYFGEDTQSQVWRRMASLLTPQGVLYIGHSERVNGPAAAQLRADGITTYRLTEPAR